MPQPRKPRILQGMTWAKETGKPIHDATEPLELALKRGDINKGKPNDQTRCAFACCIEREYHTHAWVGRSFTYIEWATWIERFRTSTPMTAVIAPYDRTEKMEPGDFRLAPVPPTLRRDAQRAPAAKVAKGRARSAPRDEGSAPGRQRPPRVVGAAHNRLGHGARRRHLPKGCDAGARSLRAVGGSLHADQVERRQANPQGS